MILCSALYYPGTLDHPESLVRDNRWYPGKASNTFSIWWAYVRRHYPDTRVVLFADRASPIPWTEVTQSINEQTRVVTGHPEFTLPLVNSVTIVPLSAHAGQYFRPMQRNLVEAICLAYRLNEDLLWWDNDAFCATDIRPLIRGVDFAAPSIATHQQTADSVFTYISAARLHALDPLGIDLPTFLTTMLNEGPTETRMHTLQEGGLYKLFAYGRTRELGPHIELSHLSCYDHFVAFLRRNPLDTPEYRALVAQLEAVDWNQLPGVDRVFHDMDWGSHLHLTP